MKDRSPRGKLRYLFENVISKGTIAIIALLGAFSAAVVAISAVVISLAGLGQTEGEDIGILEAAWQSFMRTLDAGTVAGDSGWGLRTVMLLVTLCGVFIVSVLIGTITSGLENKLTDLRKGRSKVFEKRHTLILGWSSKIFSIISELVIANENQKSPRIVILAPKDKVEMEDEIKARIPDSRNTKIICRTGSPLDLTDLEVVSPNDARSVIVLSPEDDHSDTAVIKTILALTNSPSRNGSNFNIVAEIRNAENIEIAELVGNNETKLVLSSDLIAKVTAQTCRQSGLSVVYTELLDFDGAEIYFTKEDALTGKTYKDALFGFQKSAVIGLRRSDGEILLNPDMSTLIEPEDQIIAISMDDDTIEYTGMPKLKSHDFTITGDRVPQRKEKTLILGWNDRGSAIVQELDNYVAAGSEILVLAETDLGKEYFDNLQSLLKCQTINFKEGNITDRKTLDSIKVDNFDHIIILCYPGLDTQHADAKTLIALLHLRNISEKQGKEFSIVSEMLDIKNQELAQVTKADDFIVSDKLVSLMLSQLSENGELKKVFDQLFAADGSEVYLKPIHEYFKVGEETNFYTLVESAALRGETAIGYKRHSLMNDPKSGYGVVVNPDKDDLITFDEDDKIIVLSEN